MKYKIHANKAVKNGFKKHGTMNTFWPKTVRFNFIRIIFIWNIFP